MAKSKRLAEKLRLLRTLSGHTQEEVAGHLGVTRSTYSYYERGTTKPSPESLWRLCKHYGVHGDYFLDDEAAPDDFGLYRMNAARSGPDGTK